MLFRYWRGLLVALSWVVSPLVWLSFNLGVDQCGVDDCAPHRWWDAPVFLLEVFAPALLATVVWYLWRRERARRRGRRLTPRTHSRRSAACASSASSLSSQA